MKPERRLPHTDTSVAFTLHRYDTGCMDVKVWADSGRALLRQGRPRQHGAEPPQPRHAAHVRLRPPDEQEQLRPGAFGAAAGEPVEHGEPEPSPVGSDRRPPLQVGLLYWSCCLSC